MLRERLALQETENQNKMVPYQQEIRTLQQQNEDLKKFIQREQDAHRQELVLRDKQNERTQEKVKQESLKESGLRIVEAEEAVKVHEERH